MKLYCDKTRARYAAKRELAKGSLNAEPKEGVDFLVVEEGGKFGWRPLEMRAPAGPVDHGDAVAPAAKPKRFSRRASVKAMVDAAQDRPEVRFDQVRFDHAEQTLAAETAPEWPTSFVPDAENGEIASREYGMLLTRERAVEAAQAAGATDAVITQTGRGMFVWRTSQLDKIWKENAAPKPAAARKEKAAPGERPKRGGSKLDIAENLLRRPEGATPEEIAAQVDGWDARTAKIRIGTCLKLTRKLPIQCAVEEGRGKVYRIAA